MGCASVENAFAARKGQKLKVGKEEAAPGSGDSNAFLCVSSSSDIVSTNARCRARSVNHPTQSNHMLLYFVHDTTLSLQQSKLTPGHWLLRHASKASSPHSSSQPWMRVQGADIYVLLVAWKLRKASLGRSPLLLDHYQSAEENTTLAIWVPDCMHPLYNACFSTSTSLNDSRVQSISIIMIHTWIHKGHHT